MEEEGSGEADIMSGVSERHASWGALCMGRMTCGACSMRGVASPMRACAWPHALLHSRQHLRPPHSTPTVHSRLTNLTMCPHMPVAKRHQSTTHTHCRTSLCHLPPHPPLRVGETHSSQQCLHPAACRRRQCGGQQQLSPATLAGMGGGDEV